MNKRTRQITLSKQAAHMYNQLRVIAESRTDDPDELREVAKRAIYWIDSKRRPKQSDKPPRSRSGSTKLSPVTKKDKKLRDLKQLNPNEAAPAQINKLSSKKSTKLNKKGVKKKGNTPRVLPAFGQSKKPGSHSNQF